MLPVIATGVQNFAKLRQNNCFYIDKTKFIKNWWNGYDDVTLITRPRRFGKTLMLDMVNTFFSPEFAGRADLFEGLEILNDDKFRNLQGTIPVIYLSFADIKEDTLEKTISSLKELFTLLFRNFAKLLDISKFSDWEKKIFSSVHEDMSDLSIKRSLRNLAECLTFQYKTKPIILLDEYDTPLHEAWLNNYWDDLVNFMRGFFNSTFKSNPYLDRALITGITRISKESIFSDMNNLKVVGITSNLYNDCFGFTEEEVFTAMDEYGLTNKEEVKKWYDGFIFGNLKEIYNPWSIINFLSERKLEPYWKASSSNSLVADLITHGNATLKQDTATLLEGKSIPIKLHESIVFPKLYTKEGAIWSLLLQAGYVKPLSYNPSTQISEVALTNYESRIIFEDFITEWFDQVRQAKNEFNQALLKNNLQDMNIFMSEISEQIFSYFDTSKQGKSEPENFYHAFVLGLILDLKDKYKISSNRDSGFGRYDVMLSPRCLNDPGIVIEFKRFRKNIETSLEDTCANALKQIYEKHYTAELKKDGLTSNQIYVYGFAFKGKEVLISGGGYDTLDWPSILKK